MQQHTLGHLEGLLGTRVEHGTRNQLRMAGPGALYVHDTCAESTCCQGIGMRHLPILGDCILGEVYSRLAA